MPSVHEEKVCGPSMQNIKAQEVGGDPAPGGDEGTTKPAQPYLRMTPLMEGLRELRTPRLWRDVICEVLITFLLVFFLTGIGSNFGTVESPSTPLVIAGLGAGIYVFALIEGFGHIQLSSMNPAAALFFMLTGKISVFKAFLFVTAECLGSILGAALIYSCAPPHARMNLRPLGLHPEINSLHGVVIEWVVTASLIMVLAGALDERNRKVFMPGLPVGMAVGGGILCAGQFTGGALNPMVTFGPAVVTGVWENQWVYWAGPLLGGITGTLLYHGFTYDKGVFSKQEERTPVKLTKYKQGDYLACAANEPNQNNNALPQENGHC